MYRNKAVSIFFAILAILFVALTLVWAILVDLAMGLFVGVLVTLLLGIAGWFVLTLILYVRAKKRGSDDLPIIKTYFTVATILVVFIQAIIVLLIGFFVMAVSHM